MKALTRFYRLLVNFKPDMKLRYRLMLIAILGGYFLIFLLGVFFKNHHSTCIFKNITGIPCPGCGMGRASIALLTGHFVQSFFLNPLAIPFTIVVLISMVWIIYDLKTSKTGFYEFVTSKYPMWVNIILAILIVTVWIWNIYHGI